MLKQVNSIFFFFQQVECYYYRLKKKVCCLCSSVLVYYSSLWFVILVWCKIGIFKLYNYEVLYIQSVTYQVLSSSRFSMRRRFSSYLRFLIDDNIYFCIYNNLHYAYSQHIVLRRFAPCFILKGEKQDVEDETPLS